MEELSCNECQWEIVGLDSGAMQVLGETFLNKRRDNALMEVQRRVLGLVLVNGLGCQFWLRKNGHGHWDWRAR